MAVYYGEGFESVQGLLRHVENVLKLLKPEQKKTMAVKIIANGESFKSNSNRF